MTYRMPRGPSIAARPRGRSHPVISQILTILTRNIDEAMPTGLHAAPWMAGIAQLVERQVVVLDVTGSSPVARPTLSIATCRMTGDRAAGLILAGRDCAASLGVAALLTALLTGFLTGFLTVLLTARWPHAVPAARPGRIAGAGTRLRVQPRGSAPFDRGLAG